MRMAPLWMWAIAFGLGLLALGALIGSLLWRRRLVWLRRLVGAVLLVSSIVIGLIAWSANATPSFVNRPAPLAASAMVFAVTSDTTVTAFQATTGKTAWGYSQAHVTIVALQQYQSLLVVVSDETSDIYHIPPQGTLLTGLDATNGHVRWQSNMRDYALFQAMNALGVSVHQGSLYLAGVPIVNGVDTSQNLLLAVDMTTGRLLWRAPDGAPIDGSDDWMPKLASDANGLYVDIIYAIAAFATRDGAPLWGWSTDGSEIAGVFASGGLVFGVTRSQRVIALNATTGAVLWNRTLGSLDFAPTRVVAQGDTVYVSGPDNGTLSVYALATSTGAQMWRRDLGANSIADGLGAPVFGAGQYLVSEPTMLIVNAADGVYALNSASGAQEWRLASTSALYFEGESGGGEWTRPGDALIAPTTLDDVLFLQGIQFIPTTHFLGFGQNYDRPYLYAVSVSTGQPYWRTQRAADFPIYPHIVF